ncbi:MAG: histidine kinase [Salinivirgaceae bacterium]|nr:histidine kinase [Salinivirgaceae bacterium]
MSTIENINNNISNKPRFFKILIHSVIWIFLLCMPILLSTNTEFVFWHIVERWWVSIFLYAIVFYINYLSMVDKLFFGKKKILFFGANILILFALACVSLSIRIVFFNWRAAPHHMEFIYWYCFSTMFSMVLPMVMAIAIRIYEHWQEIETKHQKSAAEQLQTELKHLEYQIQPHFFFNSLNNIYSLVDISPERAKETIHNLSKLMRYLLYETNSSLVPLDGEIAFMSKYIELMKLRSAATTVVEYDFPENTNGIEVAPLMFISLIENSFKHGILPQGKSELKFSMKIEGRKIIFQTSNPYFEEVGNNLTGGSSIGLENIRRRLNLIYPDKSEFYTKIENGKFLAYLSIEA